MSIRRQPAKEQKQWSRRNGWSLPLHWLQVSAWCFLLMFAFLYFGVLVPNLPEGGWQISAYVINGFVFLFHIVIHLISVSLNPADMNVRAKENKGPLPAFDRTKHSHVIENQYCHICEVKVGRKSKHCSVCNKCVSEFDHHCKWLNNCVGGRNYRLFISCVSSALLGSLIIFVSSLVLIVAYFGRASWLIHQDSGISSTPFSEPNRTTDIFPTTVQTPLPNATSPGAQTFIFGQVHGGVWICIVFLTAILSLVAISLLGHLLGFHIFLMCQNFSTFDYIVHKRDQANAPATRSEKSKPKRNFDCHVRLLQHIKTKKGNQISPKSQDGSKGDDAEEWEMQASAQHNKPAESKKPAMPVVTENKCAATGDEGECPLENYVGNVYIGSPHRRRHYLEPINLRQKVPSPKNKDAKKEGSPVKIEAVQKENIEKDDDSITENDNQESGSASQSQTYNPSSRRHHRSPSPAPLLSPILESEISSGSAIVSWKHRSVSEQSLHTLEESEEDVSAAPSTSCAVQVETESTSGLGNRENSGSLSNLFLSKDQLEQDLEEDNNNNEEDVVHEVCIIPQGSPLPENNRNSESVVEVIENGSQEKDREVWAYASRNGYQLRDGFVSFRRSTSMQDNEGGIPAKNGDPLTRCCSEDELKSVQRMTKLQRRLSEDRDLWMLKSGNNIHSFVQEMCKNPALEHSPRAGISATAVFCVEDTEDSFRIPGIPFGLKRKYNHFSVPNHIVLPCSNSVHPESRKRTRPVGSKPPKAFHA